MQIFPFFLICYVLLFTAVPVAVLGAKANLSCDRLCAIFFDPAFHQSLLNSVVVALLFAILTTILGYTTAVFLETRLTLQWKSIVLLSGLLLFAVSDSTLWIFGDRFLRHVINFSPDVSTALLGLGITAFVFTLRIYPAFSILPLMGVAGALKQAQAAVNLGAVRGRLWRTFYLRRSARLVLLLFVFAFIYGISAGSKGTLSASSIGTITDLISSRMIESTQTESDAAALTIISSAIVMALFVLSIFIPYQCLSPETPYISSLTEEWQVERNKMWQWISARLPLLLIAVIVGLLAIEMKTKGVGLGGLPSDFWSTLKSSLAISVMAASVSGFIAVPAAYVTSLGKGIHPKWVLIIAVMPLLVPNITFASSILEIRSFLETYTTSLPPIIYLFPYYVLRGISFVYLVTITGFIVSGTQYEVAAINLGSTFWKTFWRITFPRTWPMIATGLFISFATNLNDYDLAHYLSGTKVTLGQMIKNHLYFRHASWAFSLSLVLIIAELLGVLLLARLSVKKSNG